METDDGRPAAYGKNLGKCFQSSVEVVELVVYHDPQGLEDTGRRVYRPVPVATGNALADQLGKLSCGLDPCEAPGLDNSAGNPAAEPLFPVVKKHLGKLLLRESVQELGGGWTGGWSLLELWVKPHVQRSLRSEAEPAVRPGKLVRGNPQIKDYALNRSDP
jgi:hypothetical protein